MKKLAIETRLMKKSYCLKAIAFLLPELHNKQIIIEKLLDNKHISDNQKQKVLHQENQLGNLLET